MCNPKQLSNKVQQFNDFSFCSSLEQPNYWGDHSHPEMQITLPQDNARAWIDCRSSKIVQIEAGQSLLIAPNKSHSLEWRETANLTVLYLHPNLFAGAIGDTGAKSCLSSLKEEFSLVDDLLIQQIGSIFRYLCEFDLASDKLYVENLSNFLAVHLLKKYLNYSFITLDNKKELSPAKLNSIFDYVENNLDLKLTLSDLAAIAGVGKFYFCRLFKNSTNTTPYKYILQRRIERAKTLLEGSTLPVADISLECGFSSQSHLSKHFRSLVGISPTKYRQSVS